MDDIRALSQIILDVGNHAIQLIFEEEQVARVVLEIASHGAQRLEFLIHALNDLVDIG